MLSEKTFRDFAPRGSDIQKELERARRRRVRLGCEHDEPDNSEEESNIVLRSVKHCLITEHGPHNLVHARFYDGELYHGFIDNEAILTAAGAQLGKRGRAQNWTVHDIVAHEVCSGYCMSAYGWNSTTGVKLCIMAEREAEAECPWCNGKMSEEETNEAEPRS